MKMSPCPGCGRTLFLSTLIRIAPEGHLLTRDDDLTEWSEIPGCAVCGETYGVPCGSAADEWRGKTLSIVLPLPPPDNACHYSGRYNRYPQKAYKDWLAICAPLLREVLAGREPDTEQWWEVRLHLSLGSQGDGQNYLKPVLDLLSGACLKDGRIEKPGGLWNDDRRVRKVFLEVSEIRHPEPHVTLWAQPAGMKPRDVKEWEKHLARLRREGERERKAAERAARVSQKARVSCTRKPTSGGKSAPARRRETP